MARLENESLKIRGSIGGLSFTQDERGTVVKEKPAKKKWSELTEGTQKSAMEMKGASKMGLAFRRAFNIENKVWMDHYFSGRLNGKFRILAMEDKERPAPRHLDLRRNGHAFEGFECIDERPLWMSVGGLKIKPVWNPERTHAVLTLPELNVKKQITAPDTCNHISFAFAVVPVPNYAYNTHLNDYVPLANIQERCKIKHSPILSLKPKTIGSQKLELRWEKSFSEEVALVAMLGVRFYVGMNGELWQKKGTEAMRVLGVV